MSPMSPVVTCREVTVTRGDTAVLDSVDLTIGAGEWVSLVGPNGAGKSTLLLTLAGLLAGGTVDGAVEVAGHNPRRASRRTMAGLVALMPQRPVLPEAVTVRELVSLGRTPRRALWAGETAVDRALVEATLERLELSAMAGRGLHQLSGGELQRVILARALVQEPQVLLLDEPTSALDIGHQQSVLDLVDDLRRQDQITVVAAMHDLTVAGQYADRVVLLADGRVVADGAPAEVLAPQRIEQVYEARVLVVETADGPAVIPYRAMQAETDPPTRFP